MKDLSIYIHIPFCISKCLYCDFASYSNKQDLYKPYIEALVSEIKTFSDKYKNYTIKTIFIGGGTPTIIDSSYINEIIKHLKSNYNIYDNAEITIESNPGTITYEKLAYIRDIGINRISIGLQSWQNRLLKVLGRIYTKEQFIESFNLARKANFNNINIDIMFALPQQTIFDWEETLKNVIKLKPEHISAYSLIIEEGTPFEKMYTNNELILVDELTDRNMYYTAKTILNESGYNHYEISNFAIKDFESKHNIVYWKQQEYIGFGLGSHSYINKERFHNTYDLNAYIYSSYSKNFIKQDIEKNNLLDEYSEYMFLGLRLIKGVSEIEFYNKFGIDIYKVFNNQIQECINLKLIKKEGQFLSLTDRGIDVSNIVFEKFLTKL